MDNYRQHMWSNTVKWHIYATYLPSCDFAGSSWGRMYSKGGGGRDQYPDIHLRSQSCVTLFWGSLTFALTACISFQLKKIFFFPS